MKDYDALKKKYEAKCLKLKRANAEIKSLKDSFTQSRMERQMSYYEMSILKGICGGRDISFYDVTFKNGGKEYIEKNVESYGVRWLGEAVCIAAARRNVIIDKWDVKIINVKKLY